MSLQDHPELLTARDRAASERSDGGRAGTGTARPGKRPQAANGHQAPLYPQDHADPADRHDQSTPLADVTGIAAGSSLVVGPESGTWRRRLGAQAWSVLEQLALAAHHDGQGWAAPVGVRGLAQELGITKDTAARAVTALRVAGLVTLQEVERIDQRRRTGYRLHLPDGIQLYARPEDQDSPSQRAQPGHCPDAADRCSCPNNPDGTPATGMSPVEPATQRARPCVPRERHPAPSPTTPEQRTLFEPPAPDASTTVSAPAPDLPVEVRSARP